MEKKVNLATIERISSTSTTHQKLTYDGDLQRFMFVSIVFCTKTSLLNDFSPNIVCEFSFSLLFPCNSAFSFI